MINSLILVLVSFYKIFWISHKLVALDSFGWRSKDTKLILRIVETGNV